MTNEQSESPPRQAAQRTVTLGELSEPLPQIPDPKPGTFAQLLGSRMAVGVLIAICVMTVVIWTAWWFERPTLEQVKALLGTSAAAKEILEAQRQMQTEHLSTFRTLFELTVSSVLLPIFTLAAGYAFGSKAREG